MFPRIHIIGGPGSGKTFAAQRLSQLLDIPAYDLDELFWDRSAQRYGVRAPEAERDIKLVTITQQPSWIIEGVYHRWLRPSFVQADAIFVLRPNVYVRDWRILRRFVARKFGVTPTKRENLLDLYRLVVWNHGYDTDNLRRALEFVQEFQQKVFVCRSADGIVNRTMTKAPINALQRTAGKPAVAEL